jgi:hypothetical protein
MNTNDPSNDLREEYRHLLRWYPRAWRRRNEEVMIGTLLEDAHAARRSHPTPADRRSLMIGAMVARAAGSGKRSLVGLIALAAGTAFSIFYVGFIGWDPVHHYAGYLGPFTNPSIVIGALLAGALVLALARMSGLAHLFAFAAAAASVVIGLLAWHFSWLGPSLATIILFTGFALLGLTGMNGIGRAIRLLAALALAAFAGSFVSDLFNPGVGDQVMLCDQPGRARDRGTPRVAVEATRKDVRFRRPCHGQIAMRYGER